MWDRDLPQSKLRRFDQVTFIPRYFYYDICRLSSSHASIRYDLWCCDLFHAPLLPGFSVLKVTASSPINFISGAVSQYSHASFICNPIVP